MLDTISIDDLALKPSDNGTVTKIGGFGLPTPRQTLFVRAERHGTLDHTAYHDGRVITLEGAVWGSGSKTAWDALDDLKRRLALGNAPVLRFRRQGRAFDERVVAKVATPVDDAPGTGFIRWAVSLLAADPRIYGDALKSGDYDPAASLGGGGVTFPLDFPLVFSTTTASHLELLNSGNFSTPPTLVVNGPVENPTIDNDTLGESIRLSVSLGASDTLEVDVATRTVSLNGTVRQDLLVVSGTTWWELVPGTNRVRLRGTGMSLGVTRLTVRYRDARI